MNEGLRVLVNRFRMLPANISRSFKVLYVNGMINGLAMGIINTVAIVYVIEIVAKDPIFLGLFFSVFSLASLPIALIAGQVSDKLKRRKPLIVSGYLFGRIAFFLSLIHI